jgi:probable HAF family extracellular repeat protein
MIARSSIGWRVCHVLALIAGLSEASSAGFTIQDLGILTQPGTSGATSINQLGAAAGFAMGSSGASAAVETSGSGGFQLAPVPAGSVSSLASSINILGSVAGTYTNASGVRQGFYTVTNPVTMTSQAFSIGLLSGNGGSGTFTQANGINGSGQVVGTGDIPGGLTRAFVGGAGGSTTIIGPLGGSGASNSGNGINDNGVVVGTSETSPGGLQHAFLATTTTGAIDLLSRNSGGNFTFSTYGMAIANNSDVAGYGAVGTSEHAFYAASGGGTLVDLGLVPGASSSYGLGLNDMGLVVGDLGFGSNGPTPPNPQNSRAFLWGGSNGIFDLNSLISTSDQSNWVLASATGINDNDQISGEGYLNGVLHGFILTPISGESIFSPVGAVPAPSSVVLSVLGLGITIGWFRFKRGRSEARGVA